MGTPRILTTATPEILVGYSDEEMEEEAQKMERAGWVWLARRSGWVEYARANRALRRSNDPVVWDRAGAEAFAEDWGPRDIEHNVRVLRSTLAEEVQS